MFILQKLNIFNKQLSLIYLKKMYFRFIKKKANAGSFTKNDLLKYFQFYVRSCLKRFIKIVRTSCFI